MVFGVRGPKAILSSTIASALAEYFEVDPKTIEANLVSDAKIVLHNVRLRPQTSRLHQDVNGRTVVVNVSGLVEEVAFTWSWAIVSKKKDPTGLTSNNATGEGWIRNATLTIKGLKFKAELSYTTDDTDTGPLLTEGETKKEPKKETSTDNSENNSSKNKGGIQAYMQKQVKLMIDSLTLKVTDMEFTVVMPQTDHDEKSSSSFSIVVGGKAIELLSFGRKKTGTTAETESLEAYQNENESDENNVLEQRLTIGSFYISVIAKAGADEEAVTHPLIEPFSYSATMTRLAGDRFAGGFAYGLEVVGQPIATAVEAKANAVDNGIIFHAGTSQILALTQLGKMVLAPPKPESEDGDKETAEVTGEEKSEATPDPAKETMNTPSSDPAALSTIEENTKRGNDADPSGPNGSASQESGKVATASNSSKSDDPSESGGDIVPQSKQSSLFKIPFSSVSLVLADSTTVSLGLVLMTYRADGTVCAMEAQAFNAKDSSNPEDGLSVSISGLRANLQPSMVMELDAVETARVPGAFKLTKPLHNSTIKFDDDGCTIQMGSLESMLLSKKESDSSGEIEAANNDSVATSGTASKATNNSKADGRKTREKEADEGKDHRGKSHWFWGNKKEAVDSSGEKETVDNNESDGTGGTGSKAQTDSETEGQKTASGDDEDVENESEHQKKSNWFWGNKKEVGDSAGEKETVENSKSCATSETAPKAQTDSETEGQKATSADDGIKEEKEKPKKSHWFWSKEKKSPGVDEEQAPHSSNPSMDADVSSRLESHEATVVDFRHPDDISDTEASKVQEQDEKVAPKSSLSVPFPITVSLQELILRQPNDKHRPSRFTDFSVSANPHSGGIFVGLSLGEFKNELLQLQNAATSAVVDLSDTEEVHDFRFAAESGIVTAGYSSEDWAENFDPEQITDQPAVKTEPKETKSIIEKKKPAAKKETKKKSSVTKLPHGQVAQLKIQINVKSGIVSSKNKYITIKPFIGNEKTTSKDVINYYARAILSRAPEFITNAEVLGLNVVDSGAATYAGWLSAATPMGAAGGVAGVAAVDAIRGAINVGKTKRNATAEDEWKFGDFARGMIYSTQAVTKAGAARRGKGIEDKQGIGDFAVGVTSGATNYVGKNKARLGGAGAAGVGFAVGTVFGGPLGGIAGGFLANAVTGKAIEGVEGEFAKSRKPKNPKLAIQDGETEQELTGQQLSHSSKENKADEDSDEEESLKLQESEVEHVASNVLM